MSFTEKQIEELCQKVDDIFADAPTRVRNVLRYPSDKPHLREAYYLGQLLAHTEEDFLKKIPGSSKHTAAYVFRHLQERGYGLGALCEFKESLVERFDLAAGDEAFKETLRALPVYGYRDLSEVPFAHNLKIISAKASWLRKQLPDGGVDFSNNFLDAVMTDPRVQAQIDALKDVAVGIVHEQLNREGGPS